jgi:PAS domain S-box-containing protein
MALQGAVSLTFGLAFLGLWIAFQREMAIRWTIAWLVNGLGVVFAAMGIGFQFGANSSPFGQALLSLPLQLGVVLFRAGTDSIVEPGVPRNRRYIAAGVAIFAVFLGLHELQASGLTHVPPAFVSYMLPRILMGISYAWAAWPLRTVLRRRWAEGVALMSAALVCLSVRMFGSAGYELWQIAHGAADRPESTLLTVAQVCLLIVFGLATALVLVEAERLEAVRAADTIRQTADALRVSEARFRFVVEHTSDAQVITGVDTRIQYAAPSCERLFGLTPSEFEGQTLLDLTHAEDRETMSRAVSRIQADPAGHPPPIAVRLRHRSGDWLPFDVTGQLVPADDHAGATLVLSIRDMAAQRQLEAALVQTRQMDSLGRMAGNIAHDFNNILTLIVGGLALVMEGLPADSPVREDVDLVQTAATSGATLTRQLLTFARRAPPATERFDVRDRIDSLEAMVGMAVGRDVLVRIGRSDDPLLVRVDPGQFDQVMMNLAINARDAMPSGGQLTIQSRLATASETSSLIEPRAKLAWARIIVEDTGVGVPAAILDRIFEPFFTTKKEGRGTGLGLSNAYGFARQAGGRLSVQSTEGVGTRLLLDLPLDSADSL